MNATYNPGVHKFALFVVACFSSESEVGPDHEAANKKCADEHPVLYHVFPLLTPPRHVM